LRWWSLINGAAAGTGTGRRRNDATARARNISGFRGIGGAGNGAAGTRNISGLKGRQTLL